MQLIKKYFPQLNDIQLNKLLHFEKLIKEWNKKINLVSRKDVENFQINHLIHSLSISKLILFEPKTKVDEPAWTIRAVCADLEQGQEGKLGRKRAKQKNRDL